MILMFWERGRVLSSDPYHEMVGRGASPGSAKSLQTIITKIGSIGLLGQHFYSQIERTSFQLKELKTMYDSIRE